MVALKRFQNIAWNKAAQIILYSIDMRKLAFILTPLIALLLSCVYYNTFYNAQQGFKRAEKNQQQAAINQSKSALNRPPRAAPPQEPSISVNDKNLYKESIDRANKVISFHPKSKYIDDALWLIGKSRYNMGEYISSDKRLGELISTYPNSEYVDGANYYIGMSQFWLKDYPKALEAFGHISEKKNSDYKSEAFYMVAYMDYVQGNFQNALDGFNKFLKDFKGSDSSGSAQFFVGACLDSLEQFQAARLAYWNVLKYSPPFDLEFDAKFAAGVAAYNQDSLAAGIKIFSDLSKQPRFFDKSSMLRLRLADGKQLSDSTSAAIAEYEKIITDFPNNPEAGEANYRLGAIYENQNDFTKAKEYYNKATQGTQDPTIRNLALTHSAQISKLENYRSRLNREKAATITADSLQAKSDSSSLPKSDSMPIAPCDSSSMSNPDSTAKSVTDSLVVVDSISRANATIALPDTTQKTAAAPAQPPVDSLPPPGSDFLTRMMQQDSMAPPDSTHRAPKIGSQAGLPMPGLPFDPAARMNRPDMPPPQFTPDTTRRPNPPPPDTLKQNVASIDSSLISTDDATIRFLLAELYDQELDRPDSALSEYLLLVEQYPESPHAPQALLAAAFIYEKKADTAAARALYNKITANYPATIQARYASARSDSIKIPRENDVFALYSIAESLYFDAGNADSAIKMFNYIERNFPSTVYAAKSAYAKAWVLDQTLPSDGDSSAYHAYQEVLDKYPDSPYIYQTKIKLGLIEDTSLVFVNLDTQQNQAAADSSYLDSLTQSLTDTVNNAGFSLPMAPPVKDTGEFLYPGGLLSRNLKGRVTFKIRLDQFGKVADFQILGPSGEQEIDSASVKCLMATTFDMSQFTDLSYLNSYFRYDIKFAPPKLDEFYNPYQKREETGP
jgi:cellulose synthase operon protein C